MLISLTDNIFTNQIDNNTVGELLVCDISDHLSVFTIYNNNYIITNMTINYNIGGLGQKSMDK